MMGMGKMGKQRRRLGKGKEKDELY